MRRAGRVALAAALASFLLPAGAEAETVVDVFGGGGREEPDIDVRGDEADNKILIDDERSTFTVSDSTSTVRGDPEYCVPLSPHKVRCEQVTREIDAFGLAGDDEIKMARFSWSRGAFFGGEGRDRLIGRYGDDLLLGGRGADVLAGHGGDDVLDFRFHRGKDILRGGSGDDRIHTSRHGEAQVNCGYDVDILFIRGGNSRFPHRNCEAMGPHRRDF